MFNLKQTALAVMALSSGAVFAGTMGPVCSAVNVTVPCENTAWDVGGRALYLQADSETSYGDGTIVQNTSSLSMGANPSWGWGFQLEGSYHYSTGNDFNLNWYHYRSGSRTTTLANSVSLASSNLIPGVTSAVEPTNQTTVNPAWDQVNMEFGQHVDFGEHKFARFHGGMNFSRVANTGYQYASILNTSTSGQTSTLVNRNVQRSAVYNGFGPRVGMDLNYEWGNGVGVYATGALSVLAGSAKSAATVIDWNTPAQGYTFSLNRSRVVPELDAKLGAMYTYAMAQGDLSLDVGWVWASYYSALSSGDYIAQVKPQSNDFGIQGLYFGMKWIGNMA